MKLFPVLRNISSVVFIVLCLAVYRNVENELEPNVSVQDDDPLPREWNLTSHIEARMQHRRAHVKKICHQYGLDQPSEKNRQNTHEFLINEEHGLIWCNVFKAASSSWFWNFNLLAGYTEAELLENIHQPLNLARKKYRRPNLKTLREARSVDPPPLTFMIARHPFHRLVSGYRNKLQSGDKSFRKLARSILRASQDMGSQHEKSWVDVLTGQTPIPSFVQFVQYHIDLFNVLRPFDVHWRSMNDLCSPCLNNFDVIAKVETLQEDANYIIFKTGIQDKIKPKVINQSEGNMTRDVADEYLCQLTRSQISSLVNIYKYDLAFFEYETEKYLNCALKNR